MLKMQQYQSHAFTGASARLNRVSAGIRQADVSILLQRSSIYFYEREILAHSKTVHGDGMGEIKHFNGIPLDRVC